MQSSKADIINFKDVKECLSINVLINKIIKDAENERDEILKAASEEEL